MANRIAGARFTLDGVEYKLAANNGPNHIHGVFDKRGLGGQSFRPAKGERPVRFTYLSKDGEEGYPGNVTVKLTYTLTDDNELRLDYKQPTDRATPHQSDQPRLLQSRRRRRRARPRVMAGRLHYTPTDDALIPTGQIATVKGTALDFTKPTRIGARIAQFYPRPGGYDHNFVLNSEPRSPRRPTRESEKPLVLTARVREPVSGASFMLGQTSLACVLAARVKEPVSGRVMEVRTTEPGVQLYTGNHLKHSALCLETQHYPDSVNHPGFPSTILRPGQTFSSTTTFAFSAK